MSSDFCPLVIYFFQRRHLKIFPLAKKLSKKGWQRFFFYATFSVNRRDRDFNYQLKICSEGKEQKPFSIGIKRNNEFKRTAKPEEFGNCQLRIFQKRFCRLLKAFFTHTINKSVWNGSWWQTAEAEKAEIHECWLSLKKLAIHCKPISPEEPG